MASHCRAEPTTTPASEHTPNCWGNPCPTPSATHQQPSAITAANKPHRRPNLHRKSGRISAESEEWADVMGSERLTGALLDRLTHRVHIIEANGPSYRLRESKERLKKRRAARRKKG
jgi:hypothetical protein